MIGRRGVLVSATLALLVTAVAANPATAATKRINPLDFVPRDSSVNVMRSPLGIGAGAVDARFMAPLKLPTGARITGIRVFSNGVADSRAAVVGATNSTEEILVAVASTADASLDLFTPMLTNGSVNPDPSVTTVQANRLYVVMVNCAPGTAVWAVDVDFIP